MEIERFEIRLSGSGGQGIILAAIILAEAAGIYEGYNVSQTQSYGPEARGGRCKAEVVISSRQIDYPKAVQLDMMLAMNQASCDAYCYDFKPNGLLLIDAGLVDQVHTSRVVALPFTKIAREVAGLELAANMVALGALGHFCPFLGRQSLKAAAPTWRAVLLTSDHAALAQAVKAIGGLTLDKAASVKTRGLAADIWLVTRSR